MEYESKLAKTGSWKAFFLLLRQIHLPWLVILLAFVVNMTYSQLLLMMPGTTATIMSGSLEGSALWDAVLYYASYGVTAALMFVTKGISYNLSIRNARTKIWSGMTRIRMDYYEQHDPSALSSAVTNDLQESVRLLIIIMIELIPTLYYIIGAILTISDYNIWLSMSVLVLLPLKYFYMVVVGRWMYRTQKGIYGQIGSLTGFLAERIKNLPLIKCFTTEDEELNKGGEVADHLFQAKMRNTKVDCASQGISQAISVIQMVVIVFSGVILLRKGKIDSTQWVAFFLFSSQITGQFTTLIQDWQSLKSIQGMVARVVDVVIAPKEQTEQEAMEAVSGNAKPTASGDIVFNNVSFSYGEKPALRNVSFRVPAGTSAAIVGLCGSGKTTLLNLLERFYETGEGQIRIGDTDVSGESLSALRGGFSYVQQGASVFGGTVREILTYGINRDVSDEELAAAAENSGAWEFIQAMPDGLDTEITAEGQSLSGGQRQRLVLAREFLRDADILLLDEPTSALDAKTARAVEETIFRMFKGKTILLVTHDLSLLNNMDQIIVMDNGALAGNGSYQDLMESCPLFREMVRAQKTTEVETV